MRKKHLKQLAAAILVASTVLAGILRFSAESADVRLPLLIEDGQSIGLPIAAQNKNSYLLKMEYETVTGKSINPQITISLDGNSVKYSRSVTLSRIWEDQRSTERFDTDSSGNELVPRQKEIAERQISHISFIGADIAVSLAAGEYQLTLTMTSCSIKVYSVSLVSYNILSYKEYLSNNSENPRGGEKAIYLEAELPYRKSSAGIIATYDNSSPDISPSAADCTKLGLISAGYQEGQWLEWKFTAQTAGLYKMVFNYRQNSMRGLGVRRYFTLDGEPLYSELNEVTFPYSEAFTELCVSDGASPYLIYLSEGEHVFRMTVTAGALYEPLAQLDDAVSRMNKVYRDILAITGASPDLYRDYYLENEIPDLIDNLKYCRNTLDSAARSIEKLSGGRSGSETAVFDEAIRVIDSMIEKPFRIPNKFENYKSQIDAAANQSVYLKQQPLELDTIEFLPQNGSGGHIRHNAFEKIVYRIKIFLNSFTADYSMTTSDNTNKTALKVWMSVSQLQVSGSAAGREQMQVLKSLCSEEFDYPAEFSLVNTNDVITQAIISGKGPDVALFVPEQTVINLAVRGALADFSKMENISSVKERFHPSALVAAEWNGGLYGLPETQSWFMLFCRTDILESCGLEIPQTWDELYYALQVLRRQNMMVGIPEDQRIYEMLLMQQGGSVYNDDLTATCLTDEVSVGAFTAWTDFYVKHSTPLTYDFYNRFRTGEMPLGITDYTLYNQLKVAAPELLGLWEMTPVPGYESNGEINRCQPCTVNNCVVVQSSSLKNEAFRFADWWTSDEVQRRFGSESEISLGISARYNTANVNAAAGLNWTDKELKNLETARSFLWDVKQTPASYYYNRNILNAFRRVVYNYESPRDVIERYSQEIDREIERKNKQILGR